MLNHEAIGPTTAGNHLVVYQTPGCDVPTVVCVCRTPDQAANEAKRLNVAAQEAEKAIQREHELCGLFRIQTGAAA